MCATTIDGTSSAVEEVDHGVAVGAAVDAVLVLDDHDVGVVQTSPRLSAEGVDSVVAQTHDLDRGAPACSPLLRAAEKVARPHGVGG